ncbi:MAG: CoA-binding protein [Acidimicrobiia bacterium]
MTDLTRYLEDSDALVAVVGATDSPGKYGGIIYRDLKRRGVRVAAVNPHRDTVDGDPAYADLTSLAEEPTIVNLVVPPSEGMGVAQEAKGLGYRRVWLQPGAESAELIDYLDREEFEWLADACIMIRLRAVGR